MIRLRSLLVVALLVAACGSGGDEQVGAGADPTTSLAGEEVDDGGEDRVDGPAADLPDDYPPDVVIRSADDSLSLRPWTTCWSGGGESFCADGAPPEELELLAGDELIVEFPVEGWEFQATRRPRDGECGRNQTVTLESTGPTTHRLDPIGHAGEDQVDVFGRGPGGDVIVSFLWRTTADGTMPEPTASLSLLADHDGRVDSYGIEMPVQGLAATPADVGATVRVTATGGASHVIELTERDLGVCYEGDVFLSAPIEEGLAAAALGEPPFTYDVVLRLDGSEHRAQATWPDGEDPECAPCVPLTFDPPLPSLR